MNEITFQDDLARLGLGPRQRIDEGRQWRTGNE